MLAFYFGETMKQNIHLLTLACALCLTGTMAFASDDEATSHQQRNGAVFVMTNAADKNEIVSYKRSSAGTLQQSGIFSTGGRGSGGLVDPLGSQGSLLLSRDHSTLFAVNAGSGTISTFHVKGAWLSLIGHVPSGGSAPDALAQYGDLVYVLNSGGSSGVKGFRINDDGELTPIPASTRYLSTNITAAASLGFSPDGRFLVVTERLTNSLDVFSVLEDGTLSPAVLQADHAAGTFSLVFAPNGTLLVTETGPANAVNGSTLSSFVIGGDGTLLPVSAGVPTLGAATCWDVVTPDGRYVYTANSMTSTISGYSIGNSGLLTPIAKTVLATLPAGATDLDMGISADGKYLYTLNAGMGTISIFSIDSGTGTLTTVGTTGNFAPKSGFNGLAAY